jgi:hypothetical protein
VTYTILVACRSTGINPTIYLADVLRQLPIRKANDLDDLLPDQWAAGKN